MRTLSSLLLAAAMFVTALTGNAATVCQGKFINPVPTSAGAASFP